MPERLDVETRSYFAACAELRSATRAGNAALADLALGEITAIWLYSNSSSLKSRCAEVLDRHGWANEMARHCAA